MTLGDADDRLDAVMNGWLPVSALDDRKLAADYPKYLRRLMRENSLDPGIRKLYDNLATELYTRADEKLKAGLLEAVDTMIELFQDMTVEPSVRLRAATYVFERMRGKTPDVVEVRQDKPFQTVLHRIVSGERPAIAERLDTKAEVVDGEVVSPIASSNGHGRLAEEDEFIRNWKPDKDGDENGWQTE